MYDNAQIQSFNKLTNQYLDNLPNALDIESLRDVLRFHEYQYYVPNKPLITDRDYDILFNHLRQLEEENPNLITPDSPTQRVATDLNPDMPAVKHIILQNSVGKL